MTNAKVVTLKDLEKEFELDGRIIRRKVRSLGYKAAKGKDSPNRYQWDSNSPELKKIRVALKTNPNEDKENDNKAE